MRLVERHAEFEPLRPDEAAINLLSSYLTREVEDALSARQAQEAVWRERLRAYDGVPRNPVRSVPIENAPNIEITLGAIATDAVYAQALDLLFNISPPVTVRAVKGDATDAGKALQRFIDWGVKNEWALYEAAENSVLDDVQLGTGAYYIPFVEHKKKTKVSRTTSRAPRILTVPPEDVLVPGGAHSDLQTTRWAALRFWYNEGEVADRAKAEDWDGVENMIAVGTIGWVRTRREQLGRTNTGSHISYLFEVYRLWLYFDIDGDGFDEDLMVVWDRTSRTVLFVGYNPYDTRPIEVMRYQLRAHLFYGLGVMDMVGPYQEETTEIHNFRVLNMLLANSRVWKAKEGSVPDEMKIWPGKIQFMQNPDDLDAIVMADVYPSIHAAEAMAISLAEKRVGVADLINSRPVGGSRTPGITALSLLQQAGKRFSAAFGAIRSAASASVRQCLYRYQERILAGDKEVEDHIARVLGDTDAQLVIELLRDPEFDEAVAIEMTQSSISVNKESDRQNALLLVNILAQYYQRTLELVAIAANPQTPEAVRDVAKKIADSAGEIIDRTIRTFDQIRDPEAFIVHVEDEFNKIEGLSQEGMLGLSNLIQSVASGIGQGAQGQPALPETAGA